MNAQIKIVKVPSWMKFSFLMYLVHLKVISMKHLQVKSFFYVLSKSYVFMFAYSIIIVVNVHNIKMSACPINHLKNASVQTTIGREDMFIILYLMMHLHAFFYFIFIYLHMDLHINFQSRVDHTLAAPTFLLLKNIKKELDNRMQTFTLLRST